MNISEYTLRNSRAVWFALAVIVAGGIVSFNNLGKKEDSTFVIKSAAVSCSYAGATPEEVERLITEPIERELQSMRRVRKVTSESRFGQARIMVELEPSTSARDIPQLWDELRRKALDIEPHLPDGASQIVVGDDFGDLYGLYYGLAADRGFSPSELRRWAQHIKSRIVTIDGVQKVTLTGEQSPVVNIYISLSRLANFAIRPEQIVENISQQNTLVESGEKRAGELEIRILEMGTYRSTEEIADQLMMAEDGRQYRLGDVARIEQGYASPPAMLMRIDSRDAVGIGISTEAEADVVRTGRAVAAELRRIEQTMPIGLSIESLYPEDRIAREANRAFLLNLVESVAIVTLVILVVMGARAALLIGSSLIFSIGGTLLLMQPLGETMNRTSLAGFIIAMGMLVDNAIVVTDNAQKGINRGVDPRRALIEAATRPRRSLLCATLIAIASFLPLYLAPSSVAEIIKPLFVVVALSLMLSWVLALTQTPLFGLFTLRREPEHRNRFAERLYRRFDSLLEWLLRRRWGVTTAVVLLFAGSVAVMARLPQNFFPELDKPYFRADVWLPEGFDIRTTERHLESMSRWLMAQKEVVRVSTTAGGTPPRYYLASSSVSARPNFGNLLVEVENSRQSAEVKRRFDAFVNATLPDVWLRSSLFKLSPVPDAAIEFGFLGENLDTLTRLAAEAEAVMRRTAGATNIRNSAGNRIATWQPLYSQMKGQRIGISRRELSRGITVATRGYPLGEYREGDQVMPILLKDENIDYENLANLEALPIFNPKGRLFSLGQATDGFRFEFRRGVIRHHNRERVVKAQCDPMDGVNTAALQAALRDSIARIVTLPEGYTMQTFGESESSEESNAALGKYMPLTMVIILATLIILFGNYRDPLIVIVMIPLIFIGVVAALAVSGKMFNFFSLLGLLGLVGMNVKSAVVLIEEIARLRQCGIEPYTALKRATRNRIVPVVVAAVTTVLGMLPLVGDSLFGAMAVSIMGGLIVATLLTICVLPVIYAILHNIRKA